MSFPELAPVRAGTTWGQTPTRAQRITTDETPRRPGPAVRRIPAGRGTNGLGKGTDTPASPRKPDQLARTLAFCCWNSSSVITPRSRRSASLCSWSAGSPPLLAACWT